MWQEGRKWACLFLNRIAICAWPVERSTRDAYKCFLVIFNKFHFNGTISQTSYTTWRHVASPKTSRARNAQPGATRRCYSARARVEVLEKGSLYTWRRVHILGVTMKQQVAAPPNLYDRLCNLDGPCNPPFQPFATGHFTAANEWLPFTSLPVSPSFFLSFFFFILSETNRKIARPIVNRQPETARGLEHGARSLFPTRPGLFRRDRSRLYTARIRILTLP